MYNYNNGGNITSVVTYPHTWGSLSGLTPTKTVYYTYGDSNWKDKLTSYNGQSITYDAIGNPSGVRYYNGSSTADYYFVCNWRGDVIRIFDSTGADVGGIVNAVAQAIDQGGIHNAKVVAKIALSTITGAAGGALSASRLVSNALVAVTIDGALTAVTDLGISLIDNDFNFEKIDWFETISNVAVSASTSAIVGKVYNESTSNAVSTISKSMQKGKNKIKKGLTSPKTASKVKGTIKTGQKMILDGRKNLNKINMRGSMIGSIVSGIVSTVKNILNPFLSKE